jgi:hypothetical protein
MNWQMKGTLSLLAFSSSLPAFLQPAAHGIDEIEVLVHLLVFDQRPAEDDLRDQDERDRVHRRAIVADDAGDEEPEAHARQRGEEHPPQVDEEHVADLQHPVADEQIDHALREGKGGERDDLAADVVKRAQVVIALAVQRVAVTDDLIGAVREPQKHRHHEAHEEVGRDVKGGGEGVVLLLGVLEHAGDEPREQRGLQQRGEQVRAIAQLAEEGALQQRDKQNALLAEGVLRRLRACCACGSRSGSHPVSDGR